MKINIESLIRFYDTAEDSEFRHHVSGITGMIGENMAIGLLKHYFISNGAENVRVFNFKPRQKLKANEYVNKGKRLDAWMFVGSWKKLYQIEIKSWSAHSIASYSNLNLFLGCDVEKLKNFAESKFDNQWDNHNRTLRLPYVSKVLLEMEAPKDDSEDLTGAIREPIICYWYPIARKSAFKSFFSEPSGSELFDSINFFSLSLYLRELHDQGETEIDIDVPEIETRFRYLNRIFPKQQQ